MEEKNMSNERFWKKHGRDIVFGAACVLGCVGCAMVGYHYGRQLKLSEDVEWIGRVCRENPDFDREFHKAGVISKKIKSKLNG